MGWDRAQDLAWEYDYCAAPSACVQETDEVLQLLAGETGMNISTVQWCLGVMKWDEANVRRGGWIKGLLVGAMSWPCSPMYE